jgi:sugar phosphate isomerase/epimerase
MKVTGGHPTGEWSMIASLDREDEESKVALPSLSVQLYSIREQVAADLPGSLARLAGLGFTLVEPFDLLGDPAGLRAALDANGLQAPSSHARVNAEADLDRLFDAAAAVGVQTVIHPFSPPDQWSSEDGVAAVAEDVNRAAEKAAGVGLRLGYHNHHWELSNALDGRPALERFADQLEPDVDLELDTYWAAVGGADVPALIGRLGDRVRLMHLKDGPIDYDKASQLPLGSGAMPVTEILDAATAVELGVLEFDDYRGDLFEGLAAGYAYATGLGAR